MSRFPLPRSRISGVLTALVAVLAVAVGASAAQLAVSVFGGMRHRIELRPLSFKLGGDLPGAARPGVSHPLDLRLTNPYRHSLRITRISVSIVVDQAHLNAGCRRRRDFRSVPMPRSSYPIRLRPRRTMTLRQLRVRALPRVEMLRLPLNQGACQGARLTLKFGGRARRWSTEASR